MGTAARVMTRSASFVSRSRTKLWSILQQVTERLERTLPEVPNLDNLRSFTRAGSSTIFIDLIGSAQGQAVSDEIVKVLFCHLDEGATARRERPKRPQWA
jgi:hypothetical protein